MKKGDIVVVIDSSYSLEITDKGIISEDILEGKRWIIIETGLFLPQRSTKKGVSFMEETCTNDTIIKEVTDMKPRRIVFIQSRFLMPYSSSVDVGVNNGNLTRRDWNIIGNNIKKCRCTCKK